MKIDQSTRKFVWDGWLKGLREDNFSFELIIFFFLIFQMLEKVFQGEFNSIYSFDMKIEIVV